MASTTAAGTGLAISAGSPASQTASSYAALTYTEIGNVESIGAFGAATEVVTFQPLKGPLQKHKGPTNYGSLNPTIALDELDPGQLLLSAAAVPSNAALYAIRVTKPDGSLRYFQVRVFGMPETIGAANSMITAAPVLEINTAIVKALGGAPAPLSPYLGHISTGTAHPTTLRTTGSPTQANFRSAHVMRDTVSSFQIAFRNYYRETEVGGGAVLTITAAIEYPVGTFTQVKWSGSATNTIASGAEGALSDAIALAIPEGATFYVRSFHQMSTGIIHCSYVGAPTNGTQGEFGTGSLADKTLSGTIPAGNNFCPPALIVATTTKPSFALVGDSLTVGVGETAPDGPEVGFGREFAASGFGYQKQAVGGETMTNFMSSNGSKRRAALQYASHVACLYGRNGVATASTGASTLASQLSTLKSQFPSKPLIAATITPATDSSDNTWAAGTQTPKANDDQRISYNTMLRANQVTGVAAYLEHADVVETARNSGIWVSSYVYTADNLGTHMNNAGYAAVAQAITAAVVAAAALRA